MNSIARLVALIAGLLLMPSITPSWSQPVCASPGCNPTVSGAKGNTAGGTDALVNIDETARENTAFGFEALTLNTSGFWNTALGHQTLAANTTGNANTAVGTFTLMKNTIGFGNTAVGFGVLPNNTTGNANIAIGGNALFGNTSGSDNTATGFRALLGNNGNSNTANGSDAMFYNSGGSENTAIGMETLLNNATGNRNTAIGVWALLNSTGNKNIAIGFRAGANLMQGNNNIYIGNQGVNSSEFQTMRLGSTQTSTFIAGIAGNTTVANAAPVVIDTATGQLGIALVVSSARYKRDIETMASRSEGLLKLRPVTFVYKEDAAAAPHYGLIAEEVAAVYPELVTRTTTGEVQTVNYQELIPMLLNELQQHRQALQTQQQELADLRALVGQSRDKSVVGTVE